MAVRKNNPNITDIDAIPGTYGQLHALTQVSQATGSNAPFYDAMSGVKPVEQVLDDYAKLAQRQQQQQQVIDLESMQRTSPEEILLGMGGGPYGAGPYDAPPMDPTTDTFIEDILQNDEFQKELRRAQAEASGIPQYNMDWLTDFLWPEESPGTYEEYMKQIDPEWSAADYQLGLPDLSSIIDSFTDTQRLESMAGASTAGLFPTGQYAKTLSETIERTGMSSGDFRAQQDMMEGIEAEIEEGIPGGTFFMEQLFSDPDSVQIAGVHNYKQFFDENRETLFDPSIAAEIDAFLEDKLWISPYDPTGQDMFIRRGTFDPFSQEASLGLYGVDMPAQEQVWGDDTSIVYDREGEAVQVGADEGLTDPKSMYFQPTESDIWTLQYRNVPHAVRYYTDSYEGQLRSNADLLFHIYQPVGVIEAGRKPEGDKAYNDALSQWYGAYLQQGQTGFRSLLEAKHGSLNDRIGDIADAFEAYEKDKDTYSSEGKFFTLANRFHPLGGEQAGRRFYDLVKYLKASGLEGSPQYASVANAAYEDARARMAEGELPSVIVRSYMPGAQQTPAREEDKGWEGDLVSPGAAQQEHPDVPAWWTGGGKSVDEWLKSEDWQKSIWEQAQAGRDWQQMQYN